MFIGYFTERPYQDPKSGYFGATGKSIMDLNVSNDIYDSSVGLRSSTTATSTRKSTPRRWDSTA